MRVRKRKGVEDYLSQHADLVLTQPGNDWSEIFGNTKPLAIEVGCGKGNFILGMAEAYPDINFVGIDLQETVISWALDKLLKHPLPNVRFLLTDGSALTDYFPAESVNELFLNFSDPWPKKRHAKRRLTAASFLKIYQTITSDTAKLQFKTDNQGLFEWSVSSLSEYGMIIEDIKLDLHSDVEAMQNNIETEYEHKFAQKGQPIYRLVARFKK